MFSISGFKTWRSCQECE